ncbi:MAG TPA: PQQ-binding-like beta-propeller repeat protein, partial [Kofleriaceae bacterium]|nr:PQQ-binding-like beta-propeller repeat protein [Kofleriaceae bacterium]
MAMMVAATGASAMVAGALAGCSGPQSHAGGCTKDTDCKDPRVCEHAVCVDPHSIPTPGTTPGTAPAAGTGTATATGGEPQAASGSGGPGAPVAGGPGSPPFAMFGGDARHTGRRGGPAPRKQPAELWRTAVGGVVAGSPTIGPDGTIYVAAHDGGLTAFGPDGKPRWKFTMGDR